MADHEIEEHAEAEEALKYLERLDPDDANFDRFPRELIADIRHHVEDKE